MKSQETEDNGYSIGKPKHHAHSYVRQIIERPMKQSAKREPDEFVEPKSPRQEALPRMLEVRDKAGVIHEDRMEWEEPQDGVKYSQTVHLAQELAGADEHLERIFAVAIREMAKTNMAKAEPVIAATALRHASRRLIDAAVQAWERGCLWEQARERAVRPRGFVRQLAQPCFSAAPRPSIPST